LLLRKKAFSGLYTKKLIFDRLLFGDWTEAGIISDKNGFAEYKGELYG